MSTISSSTENRITSAIARPATTATSATSTGSGSARPSISAAPSPVQDSVRISSEARESGGGGGTLSLLQGLQDNFGNSSSNPANGTANSAQPGATDAAAASDPNGKDKPLSNDQKIEKLQSTLEQFKGLKGEELTKKLEELKKSDPELAALLEKLLGDEGDKKDEKKTEAAKEAKKAGGGDDGAPSETFLWKPVSDSDGKLAVLLPSSLDAQSVTVSGPNFNETVNAGGRQGGRGNGQRQHFRYSKPGTDMQGPVQVSVQLTGGGSKTITINKPSERNEGGKLQDAGAGMAGF